MLSAQCAFSNLKETVPAGSRADSETNLINQGQNVTSRHVARYALTVSDNPGIDSWSDHVLFPPLCMCKSDYVLNENFVVTMI